MKDLVARDLNPFKFEANHDEALVSRAEVGKQNMLRIKLVPSARHTQKKKSGRSNSCTYPPPVLDTTWF